MNYRKVLIILTACFVTVAAVGGAAVATDYTFTGNVDNTWMDPDNWDPNTGPPGASDKAIIPPGEYVQTDAEDVGCLIIELQYDDDPFPRRGELGITEGSVFSLYGGSGNDSTINGRIAGRAHASSDDEPVLRIVNSTTMIGTETGSIFCGGAGGSAEKLHINGESSDDVLTLQRAENSDGFSLGGNVEVHIALVHNSVVYVSSNRTIVLDTYAKSGNGLWWVQGTGATLEVDVAVSGSAKWFLEAPFGGSPTIQINAACTSLTGHVEIAAGTFDVNANFWTTGEITYRGGTIDVDGTSPISASFGQ
jgi:hypothetical protein